MSRSVSNALLLLTALIWGTTFVAQQVGMRDVGPLTYTGARFFLGALCISPFAWREYRRLRRAGVRLGAGDWLPWAGLGALLAAGSVCQQIGVSGTSVSNAGFLTALYVPLVPVLGWLLERQRAHWSIWPAALGSVVGTFLLSGGHFSTLVAGDWWVILSTVFWAFHVHWVGTVANRRGAPMLVACAQFVVCGALATAAALLGESIHLAGLQSGLPAILYGGVLSVGIAFSLQVVAQRHTRAADAAILLSSEILFAALAAALYLGERLDGPQWLGGLLIFASILAVQLAPLLGARRRAEVLVSEPLASQR